MVWLILLAGAISGRVILATLRSGPPTPLSRTLLFDFGVRKPAQGQVLSRRDRLWNGAGSLLAGVIAVTAGGGGIAWADHYPNLSTANYVLTGIGFVLLLVGVAVVLVGLVEVIRAPFAPPHPGS